MNSFGMGVMLGMLSGNDETVNAIKKSLNKLFVGVELDKEQNKLLLSFDDGSKIAVYDDGQSCYEHRYMTTDDDLEYFVGSVFTNIELKEAPTIENEYGEPHEVQFLVITTDKGSFTLETHNEHNGCYGGFWVVAREL